MCGNGTQLGYVVPIAVLHHMSLSCCMKLFINIQFVYQLHLQATHVVRLFLRFSDIGNIFVSDL